MWLMCGTLRWLNCANFVQCHVRDGVIFWRRVFFLALVIYVWGFVSVYAEPVWKTVLYAILLHVGLVFWRSRPKRKQRVVLFIPGDWDEYRGMMVSMFISLESCLLMSYLPWAMFCIVYIKLSLRMGHSWSGYLRLGDSMSCLAGWWAWHMFPGSGILRKEIGTCCISLFLESYVSLRRPVHLRAGPSRPGHSLISAN